MNPTLISAAVLVGGLCIAAVVWLALRLWDWWTKGRMVTPRCHWCHGTLTEQPSQRLRRQPIDDQCPLHRQRWIHPECLELHRADWRRRLHEHEERRRVLERRL